MKPKHSWDDPISCKVAVLGLSGRVLSAAAFGCQLAIATFVAFLATTATASERSAELVESFRVFCTLEHPDFSRLNEKATDMQLPARNELEHPRADDRLDHSKSWLVFLSSGPHELMGSEANGPSGKMTICGIRAPDVGADDMRFDLTQSMKLGEPISVRRSPDGQQQVTTWHLNASSNDLMLILTDGTPVQRLGVHLILLHRAFKKS